MTLDFYFLLSILVLTVIGLQARYYQKHKKQNQLLVRQGEEIKKQIQELEQRNRLLAELNVEKQQIIGVVSHDLKGPFNRIFALVQLMMLSRNTLTPENEEYLGKMHQIVSDGLAMIRNLLDNRRFEDRGIQLHLEKLDISAIIHSLVKNYVVLAENKKCSIYCQVPPHLISLTDKICVTRILDNLISNALKFLPAEKNVYITAEESGSVLKISVRDQGPGISVEDQHKLFVKYQRLTARPTGGESSTGLGLYLVSVIVSKLGGKVFCESEVGNGAEFRVELPLVVPAETN